jgi:DNA methyltransferase 1-associated protein 1
MEDLKSRYYEVAAKMMAAQKPVQYMTQQEYALHETMAHFNPKQEKLRKEFAMSTMSRSKEEAREEESLLLEIKRIMARNERFNEERRELYNRLDYPRAETDISTFKSSAGLQTLLQNLVNMDKTKKRKSIMGTDSPAAGGAAGTAGAGQPVVGPESAKRDSTAASNAATRESTAATSTPSGLNKKAQLQQQEKQAQQQQQAQQQPQQQPQAQPPERRKLSSQEEAVYGVSHHDRLGSGPTFRTEKINKLFSHKSNQQQLRISNTLNELDVPAKLAMPTAATTLQYEQLLAAVNSLLDARKVSDKLDGEIKIEQAKKAEREKNQGPVDPEKGTTADGEGKPDDDEGKKTDDTTGDEPEDKATATGEASDDKAGETKDHQKAQPEEADHAGKGPPPKPEQGEEAATEKPAQGQRERERSARPGSSSGPHKRSASVLSTMSDKSAKRQKK